MPSAITLSALDETRFGVRTASGRAASVPDVLEILEFCRAERVGLAIVRAPPQAVSTIHALESSGFLLMDTQVVQARALGEPVSPADPRLVVRPARREEAEVVAGVAARAFASYSGHYHADPRLDHEACTAVYEDWARRSITTEGVAHIVLVAELEGAVVGFSTARCVAAAAEGPLDAVDPAFQRRGVYRALSRARMAWAREQGADRLTVATLVTNLGALAGMAALGFRTVSAAHTFHRWFTG